VKTGSRPRASLEPANKRCRSVLRAAAAVLAVVAVALIVAPHVVAQGCAMCYQNAASSAAQGRAALRHGILILLLPALSLFLGIFLLIYRRRNTTRFPDSHGMRNLDSLICHSGADSTKFRT